MSRRLQAWVSIAAGVALAAVGVAWAVRGACCAGLPMLVAYGFSGVGLLVLAIGAWALRARAETAGIVRRNPLHATIVVLAVATILLAHAVTGVRRVREVPMVREPAGTYFGDPAASADALVLRHEARPDAFHLVEDAELAESLRARPDARVETTVELLYVFGSLRGARIVRVGDLERPTGFVLTSGVRGGSGGGPWD